MDVRLSTAKAKPQRRSSFDTVRPSVATGQGLGLCLGLPPNSQTKQKDQHRGRRQSRLINQGLPHMLVATREDLAIIAEDARGSEDAKSV